MPRPSARLRLGFAWVALLIPAPSRAVDAAPTLTRTIDRPRPRRLE